LQPGALTGVDAVVHLASETGKGSTPDEHVETTALQHLLDAAQAANAQFVYVSSQTANPNAPTAYGRIKWRCEQLVLGRNGIVVRPGQVYGGAQKGLFGTVCRLAHILPVLPKLRPDPQIQPVHVDDLAAALARCALDGIPSGIYSIGQTEPVGFSTFLRMLSEERFGRSVPSLPAPLRLIATISLRAGLPRSVSSKLERLRSLIELQPMQTADSLAALCITLRPLKEGLSKSGHGRRKKIIAEAATLLRYVLRGRPSLTSVKSYVRALEDAFGGSPLAFPTIMRRYPTLLSFVDQPTARRRAAGLEFWRRVDLASICAESSPAHAEHFLAYDERWRLLRIAGLSGRIALEGAQRVLDIVCGPSLDRFRPQLESL
jgi:NADH dehydrogenase